MITIHVQTKNKTIPLQLDQSVHREKPCVKLLFAYNTEIISKVKALPNRRWSQTMGCWYIPYREDYRKYIINELGGVDSSFWSNKVSNPLEDTFTRPDRFSKPVRSFAHKTKAKISIDKTNKKFYVQHSYDHQLFSKLSALTGGYWNKKKKRWVFKGENTIYLEVINILKENNITWFTVTIAKNDETNSADSIKEYFEKLLIKEQDVPTPLREYIKIMTLKRLSEWTKKTYYKFFVKYFEFHKGKDISQIEYSDIYYYIQQQSKKLNYTQLNQTIAAIKFYYEKVLGRDKMFFYLRKKQELNKDFVYIAYPDFEKICSTVGSTSDKLLLFLVYCLHLNLEKVSCLPLKIKKNTIENLMGSRGNKALNFFNELLDNHTKKHQGQKFLFEKQNRPYRVDELELKLYRVLGHYKLREIYKLQYKQILGSTTFSENTQNMYLSMFMRFLEYKNYKHPLFISDEEARDFLVLQRDKSASFQNMQINAFKFFFDKVHNKELSKNNIVRPRRSFLLPKYLDKDEVAAIICKLDNVKHQLLISLAYCAGLRRQEIQELRPEDLKLKKNKIHVRPSKGDKERFTTLSKDLHELIEYYLKIYKPVKYLFEGPKPGSKYSFTSMANVLKRGAKAAGIQRNVHLHMLRHSFSTHILEEGRDISYLKELLGHQDIRTTMRYTHIVNHALKTVTSPFDNLPIDKKYLKAKRGLSP